MKHPLLTAAALALALPAASYASDRYTPFGEAGAWKVFVDTYNSACVMETRDEAQNVVQIGTTNENRIAYVSAFTLAETGIREGDPKAVGVRIGDTVYTGDATAVDHQMRDGYTGGFVITKGERELAEFPPNLQITIFPDKPYAFSVALPSGPEIVDMMQACNAQVSGN